MRTSEIIMLNSPARRVSRACSPEATGTVSNPWLRRNESSKLRWPTSSSTIRTRGAFEPFLRGSAGIGLSLGSREEVAKQQVNSKNQTPRAHSPYRRRRREESRSEENTSELQSHS